MIILIMKHLMSINEYVNAKILPKELRNMDLLYHSTKMEYVDRILKTDTLEGTGDYDYGVATSRNKHYAYGTHSAEEDENWGYNAGHIQFILDRAKIKYKYKIEAFDWEEMKLNAKPKLGEHDSGIQSEDKIMTNKIKNISKYIIGIHIVHGEYEYELLTNQLFVEKVNVNNWTVFDENWNDITHKFKA